MVISKIQGGLGNQMFQWAVARSYSLKHNCECAFDISFYPTQTLRGLQLDEFNIEFNILVKNNRTALRILDNFNYIEIPYDVNFDTYLDGFWQSEKYFIENQDIIRGELSPTEKRLQILRKIPHINENCVSIHIRRTDYTTSNGYHPVQPIEYFQKGLDIIGDYDYILVFSDDIQWCKENLSFKNMIFIEGFSDIDDMWIMSLCKNNIISNSSFSWWGAWLNKNVDKKVIAPINWFGKHVNLNSSDIVPQNWIKV